MENNWNRAKLLRFMHRFNLSGEYICNALGISRSWLTEIRNGNRPVDQYSQVLTGLESATRKAKIAELSAYAEEMIKFYNEPI